MKEKLTTEQWTALITQASPAKLIVINYDLLLENLLKARTHMGSEKEFTLSIEKARAFLMHLVESLNTSIDMGVQLFDVYMYINKLLLNALRNPKIEWVDEAIRHVNTMRDAFEIVREKAEEEDAKPVIQNAEQIYAGLTYGKDNLVETVLTTDRKRGFQV